MRIVECTAPHTVGVVVLLPVPAWLQRRVGICAATACDARPAPPLERERLHDLDSIGAAKTESSRIGGSGFWIAPQQQPLRTRPDAMDDAILTVLAQEIGITIAGEAARSGTEGHQPRGGAAFGYLLVADIGLMVGHS